MVDFANYKALEVKEDATVRFYMDRIEVAGKTPVLIVAPATEQNTVLLNAMLKEGENMARSRRPKKRRVDAATVSQARENDREKYAKYIIRGWEDVYDSKGKAVKFSEAVCLDFLRSIPVDAFDDLRAYCSNPSNFVGGSDEEAEGN